VGTLPGLRTTRSIDLRLLDRQPDAAITSLIPSLSCRSCRPNAPFAELLRLSQSSVAEEIYAESAEARRKARDSVRAEQATKKRPIHGFAAETEFALNPPAR